jgi:hypothetical protein
MLPFSFAKVTTPPVGAVCALPSHVSTFATASADVTSAEQVRGHAVKKDTATAAAVARERKEGKEA